MKRKGIVKTFVFGITIFVLVLLAGIMTGIVILPIALVSYWVGGAGGTMILGTFGILLTIYFLGFVFGKFKVKLKK